MKKLSVALLMILGVAILAGCGEDVRQGKIPRSADGSVDKTKLGGNTAVKGLD